MLARLPALPASHLPVRLCRLPRGAPKVCALTLAPVAAAEVAEERQVTPWGCAGRMVTRGMQEEPQSGPETSACRSCRHDSARSWAAACAARQADSAWSVQTAERRRAVCRQELLSHHLAGSWWAAVPCRGWPWECKQAEGGRGPPAPRSTGALIIWRQGERSSCACVGATWKYGARRALY